MTLDVIKYFYHYNRWATELLLDALEGLSPDEYTADGTSGNGSIRDTLAHLLSVQYGWTSWFEEKITIAQATQKLLTGEEIPTVADARRRWVPIAEQTDAYIATLSEEQLEGCITSTLPNDTTVEFVRWHLLLHLANHGTHTRAQIVAAIRRAGHDPGSVEMLAFAMRRKM
jgi:uncharacterized damage-inducible protein DinB